MRSKNKKMKKQTILFTYSLITCFIISCSNYENNEKSVIKLNPNDAKKTINLSEIVDTISYIRLETIKESQMIKVGEIVIKEKNIYCLDYGQKAIFIFAIDGRFLKKLEKQGDGPDQYRKLDKFLVNEDETEIEIFDYRGENSRIITYSIDSLSFISERPIFLPISNSMRKEKNNNTYYFSTQQIENQIENNLTNGDIIAVTEGEKPKILLPKKIESNGVMFSPNTESFTTNENGEIFISIMYHNTFYKLQNKIAIPEFSVDFESLGIDNSIGLRSTTEQKNYLTNESNEKAFFPVLNINNSKIILFSYYFKENNKNHLHHYINFKENNKIFHVRDIVNNITNYPDKVYLSSYYYAVNHEVIYKDYFVDIVLPWHTNQGKIIEIPNIGTIEPEDNPVIILMKLKKLDD